MDPLLHVTLVLSLALLFGAAGVEKLHAWREWPDVLRNYQVLPAAWVPPVAFTLPAAEVAIAAALLRAPLRPIGAVAGACLLMLFGLAIGLNLGRGRREIDCGCLGGRLRQPLARWMLVRNGVLAAAALSLLLPLSARRLTRLELVIAAGAALTLALLYLTLGSVLTSLPSHRAPGRAAGLR